MDFFNINKIVGLYIFNKLKIVQFIPLKLFNGY